MTKAGLPCFYLSHYFKTRASPPTLSPTYRSVHNSSHPHVHLIVSLCRPSTGPPYLKHTISNSLNDNEEGLLSGNVLHRRIRHPPITPPAYLNHLRPPKILDLSRSRARPKSSTIATYVASQCERDKSEPLMMELEAR